MAHDAIVTPLDVVKQRLQMRNSVYRGPLHCIRTVFAQEGLRAFYASYPTTVAMNVPFQAVHFAAYESFKILFTKEGEEHGILEDFAAGGAAGALAGCVSTPFDVVKVRKLSTALRPASLAAGHAFVATTTHSLFGFDLSAAPYLFSHLLLFFQTRLQTQVVAPGGQSVTHTALVAPFTSTEASGDQNESALISSHFCLPECVLLCRRQGARDMIRAIYAADGGRGFMRGATARMLYYVPSAAICWSVGRGGWDGRRAQWQRD